MQYNRLPHRILTMAILILAAGVALARPALCDKRDYIMVYPYWTEYKGENELELKTETRQDNNEGNSQKYQMEWEHGWSDRFMTGLYGVWEQTDNNPDNSGMRFTQTKLETEYRLAPAGTLWVDPTFYLEYAKSAEAGGADELETKLILSKDLGDWNITANLVWEKALTGVEGESDPAFEYLVGIDHPISKYATVGLEWKRNATEDESILLPGLYMRDGKHWRWNIGPAIGLTPATQDFNLRSLLMYEF